MIMKCPFNCKIGIYIFLYPNSQVNWKFLKRRLNHTTTMYLVTSIPECVHTRCFVLQTNINPPRMSNGILFKYKKQGRYFLTLLIKLSIIFHNELEPF